jgi:arsenate reductase
MRLAILLAVVASVAGSTLTSLADATGTTEPVVFVCEHGNVKSLIAREWFNRLAAARGVSVRAESRGLVPEDAVPPGIAERLRGDGFDVQGFRPRALAPSDLSHASRLVMIGAEPPEWAAGAGVPVERWEGVPPASERYEASRDALRERIAALLDALAGRPPVR